MKPRLRIVDGLAVPVGQVPPKAPPPDPSIDRRKAALDVARERFGKPFAHEYGSTWKPRATRLLTEWLARRTNEKTA
jgi:hypothetical protein